jgi:hypothetical protein
MGECAYAAVSDQLLSVRGRPGRLRGVRVSGVAVVLDPFRNRPCPKPACFASVCQLMLLSLSGPRCSRCSTVEVAGVRPSEVQAPYDPTAAVRCGPYVLSRNAMSVVSFTGFPALFLVLSHSPPSLDSRRPECWEINRDLHTSMYSDVKGSVNLISQSLKYSHA